MGKSFEVIDSQSSPLGEIRLQRRQIALLGGREVLEVKLGEEYLMSSLFHDVEVALADLGLAELQGARIDVVVGGLGLGYTAVTALRHSNVQSLTVVEYLRPVIEWHEKGLVPLGQELTRDERCRFVQGDFFSLARSVETGFDPDCPGRKFHAVLLDIDHSPEKLLHPNSHSFYQTEGLMLLSEHLHSGGVFALWSDEPPDEGFVKRLESAFVECGTHVVNFHNPIQNRESSNTVYVARKSVESA
jgi:spermidine synthase